MNASEIADADDPRIADYRGVRDPEWLRQRGIFLAEGRTTVRILARSPRFELCSLLATKTALAALGHEIEPGTAPVYVASRAVLEQVSGVRFHQGCVAVGRAREVRTPDEIARAAREGPLVVLDRVTNPDNVGSIFRSAHAFGAAGVLLSPECVSPLYRKAIRTSMGAVLRLPFAIAPLDAILQALERAHVRPIALSPDAAARVADLDPSAGPVALVLGNEGDGISAAARARAECVCIPMAPGADSLNVATAAAIALYALRSTLFSRDGSG